MIRVLLKRHLDKNVVELAVSLAGADQTSWSASDIIHPNDIVDVLAERIGAELALDFDAGPTVRLMVPTKLLIQGEDLAPAQNDFSGEPARPA
jgi:hypothetical protein